MTHFKLGETVCVGNGCEPAAKPCWKDAVRGCNQIIISQEVKV